MVQEFICGGRVLCSIICVFTEDIVSFLVTPSERTSLQRTQELVAGPRKGRDARLLPFKERSHASPVKRGERCYGIALTVEAQRTTEASIASAKSNCDNPEVFAQDLADQKEILIVRYLIFWKAGCSNMLPRLSQTLLLGSSSRSCQRFIVANSGTM